MKIIVKVFPRSKVSSVEEKDEAYIVRVTAPASNNQANAAVIKLLAEHFKTSKSNVEIIKGFTSRYKVIKIFE